MTTTRTIYIGSLWHQNCDPFVTVAGYDKDQVDAKLDELAEDEYQFMMDTDEHHCEGMHNCDCVEDDIMTGGIFEDTSLDDYLVEEKEWRLSELESDGIIVF